MVPYSVSELSKVSSNLSKTYSFFPASKKYWTNIREGDSVITGVPGLNEIPKIPILS